MRRRCCTIALTLGFGAIVWIAFLLQTNTPYVRFLLERNAAHELSSAASIMLYIWLSVFVLYFCTSVVAAVSVRSWTRYTAALLFGLLSGSAVVILLLQHRAVLFLESQRVLLVPSEADCARAMHVLSSQYPGCFCTPRPTGQVALYLPISRTRDVETVIGQLAEYKIIAQPSPE